MKPQFNYWELFDREQDPLELQSVYGRPEKAAVQKELQAELARRRTELKVPDPPETMIRRAPPKTKPKAKAKPKAA